MYMYVYICVLICVWTAPCIWATWNIRYSSKAAEDSNYLARSKEFYSVFLGYWEHMYCYGQITTIWLTDTSLERRISVKLSALTAKESLYIISPFLYPHFCSHSWHRETMFSYVVLFSVFHNKKREKSCIVLNSYWEMNHYLTYIRKKYEINYGMF